MSRGRGRRSSKTAGRPVSALGTAILRVYMEARTTPSTPRSCIASISCCSRSASPSVSPMKRRWPCSRAASSAPQIRWPAKAVVATVSETNPMVWLVPVRRLLETMFGRYPVSRAARRTRASTAADMRISSRRPESTNDAAVWETPALRATSASVTRGVFAPLTNSFLSTSLDKTPSESDYPTRAISI